MFPVIIPPENYLSLQPLHSRQLIDKIHICIYDSRSYLMFIFNAALTSKIPAAVFIKPELVVAADRVMPAFLIYGFYPFQVG